MHRCFQVAEIVSMIFTQLRHMALYEEVKTKSTYPVTQLRPTLFSLALTCKAFTESALDALWYDIDSLSPLLDCLPMGVDKRPEGGLFAQSAVGPEDFAVFQKYARRVRAVAYRLRRPILHEEALRILSNFPSEPGSALLPNLKFIAWEGDGDEVMPFLRYLVPRTLVSLHLVGSKWPQCKTSLVSFLDKHFPDLKEFHCIQPPADVSDRISEYVCKSDKLTSLSVGVLNDKAMKHLMKSPSLQILNISLPAHNVWDKVDGTFLPSLTHVGLSGPRLDKAAEYLRWLRLSPETVCIDLWHAVSGSYVGPFFKQITKSFNNEKLREFKFAIDDRSFTEPVFQLHANSLDPLFRFKNLTSLLLENFFTPLLDDEKVTRIAQTWPHLQELKIGTGQDWITHECVLVESQMTMYGVAYVAQHCQQLRVLGLVFDTLAPLTAPVPDHWTNHQVDFLDVGGSTCSMKNAAQVASLVGQLFPKLGTLYTQEMPTTSPPPGSRRDAWTVVRSMSKLYAKLKETTRQSAMKEAREELLKELEKARCCACGLEMQIGKNGGEDVAMEVQTTANHVIFT